LLPQDSNDKQKDQDFGCSTGSSSGFSRAADCGLTIPQPVLLLADEVIE